jgi:hypothetical protein
MSKTLIAVVLMAVSGTAYAGDFGLDGLTVGNVRGMEIQLSVPAPGLVTKAAPQGTISPKERDYMLRSDVRASGLSYQLMEKDGVREITPKVFAKYYKLAVARIAGKNDSSAAPSQTAFDASVSVINAYSRVYAAAAEKAKTLDEFQNMTDADVSRIYSVINSARNYAELRAGLDAATAGTWGPFGV